MGAVIDPVITDQEWGWLEGIAHPVRLELMRELSSVDHATVTELEDRCGRSGPTLRRHLAALVEIGLVKECVEIDSDRRTGRPPARFELTTSVRARIQLVFGR